MESNIIQTLEKYKDIIPDIIEKEIKKIMIKKPDEVEVFFNRNIRPIIDNYEKNMESISMLPNEIVIWSIEKTEGIIFKKPYVKYTLTNNRLIVENIAENKTVRVGLALLDAVVCDSHRISNGTRFTYKGAGSYSTTSKTFGDIAIMVGGEIVCKLKDVQDPNGIRKLIYATKKQIKV